MKYLYSLLICISFTAYMHGQSKSLLAFDRIKTGGSVKVNLVQSDNYKAEYVITKGYEEDLIIEVQNRTLTVKISGKSTWRKNRDTKAKVTVYAKEIRSVDCSAGSTLRSDDVWKTPEMKINVSSGASCSLRIEVGNLVAEASSGGKISLEGKSETSELEASSGATISAFALTTLSADVGVSSGGSIKLYASESLKAAASSGGSILYKGNPEIKRLNAGMSGSIMSY
jgi:hypothetical protein